MQQVIRIKAFTFDWMSENELLKNIKIKYLKCMKSDVPTSDCCVLLFFCLFGLEALLARKLASEVAEYFCELHFC